MQDNSARENEDKCCAQAASVALALSILANCALSIVAIVTLF